MTLNSFKRLCASDYGKGSIRYWKWVGLIPLSFHAAVVAERMMLIRQLYMLAVEVNTLENRIRELTVASRGGDA